MAVLNSCTIYILKHVNKKKDSHYGMEGEYANHNI